MTIIEIGFSRNFIRNWNQFDEFYGNSKSCKNGIREETIKKITQTDYEIEMRRRGKKGNIMKKRKEDREQRKEENSECVEIKN